MKSLSLAFLLLMVTQASPAGLITVCRECPFQAIEPALAAAERGDTIFVQSGAYRAVNVELTTPVVLLGAEGAVLDGAGEGYVLKILTDSVSISGFEIVNSGRSYTKDYAAIYAFKANHFQITDNHIQDPFFGLLIEKSHHGLITGNLIHGVSAKEDDAGNGIHLWHCSNVLVEDNEVYQMRDGIYLEFVEESQVVGNTAHDNVRYGLHFMFSNHDDYLNNTFERNGAGVAVMFSKFITMRENRFLQNWGTASYGLLLKEIYDAEVTDNLFSENTVAIYMDGTTRINYTNNRLVQNGWAIKVSGGCYANHFIRNDFVSNSFDVSYNTKMNDNTFHGNYWSDYVGYDLDQDGIGDVPYRPVKLFSYIVNRTPETIILLRSLFVDIINFSEKVSPVFTPDELVDERPSLIAFGDD